jgi:hypothetical protein
VLASFLPQTSAADAGTALAGGQVMAGIYSPDQWNASDHIIEVGAAAGKPISIGGLFFNVNESPSNIDHMLEEVWSAGATPFVNIHLQTTAAVIADGQFDDLINAFATGIKNWMNRGGGRSVLLAPMPEMNGDWIPYGKDLANFKTAFTRFVTRSEAVGLNDTNTRWVFAPNGWSAPPYRIADYYPGPDFVDLIGISTYDWGAGYPMLGWTTVAQTMGGVLDELRTFAFEKPYLVAQVASSSLGGDRDAWLRDMFTYLAADPNVVAFIYFDITKETDWAIYEAANLALGFRDGMQRETTVHDFPLNTWFQPGPLEVSSAPGTYQGRFADDDFSPFQADIEWLLQHGITTGCGGNRFCPRNFVTRAEMATFLARALGLPATSVDYFTDDTATFYESDINRIREAGITVGCGANSYCPNLTTTRAEIATFLARALKLSPATFDYLIDDSGLVHEPNINALREAGITTGCGATKYCPDAILTREQMAALIHRALP